MPKIIAVSDWYNALKDDIDAVRVETVYIAQETLLKGKLEIGKLICEAKDVPITMVIKCLSLDLNISERDLWYSTKFYEMYEELQKLPEFSSKAISWNKVKKMISKPDPKVPCDHTHTVKICVCDDCGKKLDN